ncbi:hypothetical protein JCM14722_06220 [Pseudodesulfovibrio portus]|uniref:Uncharacterized protein n=1 Tax=Pseudodesulfovibrio portus TaxID=231439 RepID=A0ABM8AP27_9BACT|nr:hypothetical protein JCM14722_06220 [Pseudodesulfovibrio portus]
MNSLKQKATQHLLGDDVVCIAPVQMLIDAHLHYIEAIFVTWVDMNFYQLLSIADGIRIRQPIAILMK